MLRATGISHAYTAGTFVLRDVGIEIAAGAIRGLIGENGSGKSTLIRVLTGAVRPVAGVVAVDGAPKSLATPREALASGIGVVHQDYNLFPDLTVTENAAGIHSEVPRRPVLRLPDWRRVRVQVRTLLDDLGIDVDADAYVRDLGPVERKFVEIARAMASNPRFLILDEPTASLEPVAAERVCVLMERLRTIGVGVLFVSHRLDEVERLCDGVTVLRDGQVVGDLPGPGVKPAIMADLMLGVAGHAPLSRREPAAPRQSTRRALAVNGLELTGGGREVELAVDEGEIVGVTGLLGSGAAAFSRHITGRSGRRVSLEVNGRTITVRSPRGARRAGIGFIPEDRVHLGLIGLASVADNIALSSLEQVSRAGIVSASRLIAQAERFREALDIRVPDVRSPALTLSGGNQQKVLIARWLASGVRTLVVEEPTHGVDVGAKNHIHGLLRRFCDDGGAVIVVGTEPDEIVRLCDRVAVFVHGEVAGVMTCDGLSPAHLTTIMCGGREGLAA